jgi:hypothetical protein
VPDQEANNACFIVSPIGEAGTPGHKRARNVLEYIIKPAAEAVGLVALRADDLSQPGSITTQVIQQLISAKAVVADLTDLNPNVFYELAVRDSFGQPVVLIAEEGTKLPFDLIQQRTIFFDSTDLGSAIPARSAIERALREALDDPSAGSPVTAAVDLNTLRSGNPEERQVAELSAKVERMSQELATLRMPQTPTRPSTPSFAATESLLELVSVDDLRKFALTDVSEAEDQQVATVVRAMALRELARRRKQMTGD